MKQTKTEAVKDVVDFLRHKSDKGSFLVFFIDGEKFGSLAHVKNVSGLGVNIANVLADNPDLLQFFETAVETAKLMKNIPNGNSK